MCRMYKASFSPVDMHLMPIVVQCLDIYFVVLLQRHLRIFQDLLSVTYGLFLALVRVTTEFLIISGSSYNLTLYPACSNVTTSLWN